MNIFETIAKVSSRSEPYHSRFLVDALNDSLGGGDRSLFEGVWKLAAPNWKVPDKALISAEEDTGDGRIDIYIRCDHPHRIIVGIEVKTIESSAEHGQLERYQEGLKTKNPEYEICVSYLTPFNRERAGDKADALKTVRVFEEFHKKCRHARHLSWLDVAGISWDGNELWKQHQEYVREHISSCERLKNPVLNRGLAEFFGEERVECLRNALVELGISLGDGPIDIDLSMFSKDLPSFAKSLASAFEILLDYEDISHNANKRDKLADELRRPFLASPYREVHATLFALSKRYSHVWIQGDKDYGVRTAHKRHTSGVSLLRSRDHDHLEVGARR